MVKRFVIGCLLGLLILAVYGIYVSHVYPGWAEVVSSMFKELSDSPQRISIFAGACGLILAIFGKRKKKEK